MQVTLSDSALTESQRGVPALTVRTHVIVWSAFALVTLGLAGLYVQYREVNVWEHWRASRGLLQPSYAERIHESSIFRTRANTWSNLAYVLLGFYALALAIHDRRHASTATGNYLLNTPAMSFLFGLACCLLGFGSGFFHASLTRWGQQLDVASMYAPLLALLAISAGRYRPRVTPGGLPTWPFLAGLAVALSTLLYVYKWQMSSLYVLSSLILLAGMSCLVDLALRARVRFRWGLLSLGALVLAVLCRQTDVRGQFTGPDSWVQGHAIWHLLTAASLACAYLYQRSEDPRPQSVPAGSSQQ